MAFAQATVDGLLLRQTSLVCGLCAGRLIRLGHYGECAVELHWAPASWALEGEEA